MLDEIRRLEHLGPLVVRAIGRHAVGHVHQGVQLDTSHVRNVAFLGRPMAGPVSLSTASTEAHFADGGEQRLNSEYADAVGDEGWGVFANHNLLAQNAFAVGFKKESTSGLVFGPGMIPQGYSAAG